MCFQLRGFQLENCLFQHRGCFIQHRGCFIQCRGCKDLCARHRAAAPWSCCLGFFWLSPQETKQVDAKIAGKADTNSVNTRSIAVLLTTTAQYHSVKKNNNKLCGAKWKHVCTLQSTANHLTITRITRELFKERTIGKTADSRTPLLSILRLQVYFLRL